MDPVRHMPDRDFLQRPVRKERQKVVRLTFSVQATHAIDRTAPADCK